jgi:signal transduction histidine kinase/PAS domain-containing protein
VLAVDNVAILLLDATETMLTIHLARGPEEEVAGQVRVPMGGGVAGRIAATRAPLVIEDLRTATVANPFLRERLRSLMGVPLLVEDRIIGVVHAATTNPHHFSAGEVRLLQMIADRIALAIAGAQLHQEAQQARREAVERANQLQATIEAIADGVVVFDQDGRLLQMNATAQHLLGYAAQPAYAIATVIDSHRQVRDVRGKALPADEWPVNRVLRGEVITGAAAVDLLIRATHGRDMQVSVSGAPVRSGTGDMLGAVCVFRDVTEQRRLERRTHEALTALLAMANTLVKPPAESEPVGVESARSTPAAQPAGTVASSLIAQRLAELARNVLGCQRVALLAIEPETRLRVPIAVVGLTGEHEARWWAEYRDHPASSGGAESDPTLLARLEAGEALVLDMTQPPYDERPNLYGITTALVAPMHASNQIIGLLALDYGGPPHVFTEQEQALAVAVAQLAALVIERERLLREREEARANELGAQEAARRMHTFLGIAGHELRTPVTSIKAAVQLTERALRATLQSALPAEAAPPLQRAQGLLVRADQQANRLNRLIEDILDVTRTQTGKIELRTEPSDLAEVVRRAVEGQRPAWPGREIALALPRMPVLLILDPDRIEQVVTNFLTNALKYSAPDRPIAVQLTTTQQAARVAVRDYGPGLSPEMRTGIWEPFHQVDGIRQQSGSGVGLGLGLHICRTLIECHGGLVGIESVVGEGSTFWFELPLAPPTPRVPDNEVLG